MTNANLTNSLKCQQVKSEDIDKNQTRSNKKTRLKQFSPCSSPPQIINTYF